MPLVPEAVVAMQACARIGAIHSVVFGGFSALSMRDRIEDAEARFVITADGGYRGGKVVELKAATDKALSEGAASIEKVIVLKHTGLDVPMHAGRDLWWHELIAGQSDAVRARPGSMPSIRCSCSTPPAPPASPRASSTPRAGYLLGAKLTSKWVFDLKSEDVFWCTADVGWITGHSYVAYGPLAMA